MAAAASRCVPRSLRQWLTGTKRTQGLVAVCCVIFFMGHAYRKSREPAATADEPEADDEARRRDAEGNAFRDELVAAEHYGAGLRERELERLHRGGGVGGVVGGGRDGRDGGGPRADEPEDDEARRRVAEGAAFAAEYEAERRARAADGRRDALPLRPPPPPTVTTGAPTTAAPTAADRAAAVSADAGDCLPLPPKSKIASAVSRAKTAECRGALTDAYCRLRKGTLLPTIVPYHEPCGSNFTMRWAPDTSALAEGTGVTRPARLAFVLVAFQPGLFEQLRLLFRLLYRPQHWFLFHIDARSPLLAQLVRELVAGVPNAEIAPFAIDTIWGTSQLYKMYLQCIELLLSRGQWDFFINLSEADLPLKPVDVVARDLGHLRGWSFLTSNPKMQEKRFCEKQGVNLTWFQCDHHLFSIGTRQKPDHLLRVKGGSDWYILSRPYAEWVVRDNSDYLRSVKQWYNFSLLSGESFFHTAALNTKWCHSISWNNRRFENWQGRAGCMCTKQWVDWCGCSPLVYRSSDARRLKEATGQKLFGRKFDPRVDHAVVRAVADQASGGDRGRLPGRRFFEVLHRKGFETVSATHLALFRWMLGAVLAAAACPGAASDGAGIEHVHGVFDHTLDDVAKGQGSSFVGFAVEVGHGGGGGRHGGQPRDVTRGLVHVVNMQAPQEVAGLRGNLTVRSGWDMKGKVFRDHIVTRGAKVHAVVRFEEPPNRENPCTAFHGVLHQDGQACCGPKCGDKCGAFDCDIRGSKECCSGVILKDGRECRVGVGMAPCRLAERAVIGTTLTVRWRPQADGRDGDGNAGGGDGNNNGGGGGSTTVPAVPMRETYDIELKGFHPEPGVWEVSVEVTRPSPSGPRAAALLLTRVLVHGADTPAADMELFYRVKASDTCSDATTCSEARSCDIHPVFAGRRSAVAVP